MKMSEARGINQNKPYLRYVDTKPLNLFPFENEQKILPSIVCLHKIRLAI